MGGHSAWRKRVANGETSKNIGGAIARHHPRLGRRGKDLALNRLGNIGGRPNPKKKKTKTTKMKRKTTSSATATETEIKNVSASTVLSGGSFTTSRVGIILPGVLLLLLLFIYIGIVSPIR